MTILDSLFGPEPDLLRIAAVAWTLCIPSASAQSESRVSLYDEFDRLDWCVWNPVQADGARLHLASETIAGRTTTYLVNVMDGKETPPVPPAGQCRSEDSSGAYARFEDAESDAALGPSFIGAPPRLQEFRANCPQPEEFEDDPAERTRTPVFQRNELRLERRFLHATSAGHWYGVRFRADGAIPTCGSVRSVVAQWKFNYPDDDANRHANGYSPVLALRFDNGVLHATVQNGQCRCMVAKAAGDPEFAIHFGETVAARQPRIEPVSPLSCIWVGGGKSGLCLPEARFKLEVVADGESARIPELPDPREDWVDIKVYIESATAADGRPDGGRIEIYADDRPIVRASGAIGYSDATPTTMKFKFGHYRDKIRAKTRLLYDRICIDARDDGACAPTRTFNSIVRAD